MRCPNVPQASSLYDSCIVVLGSRVTRVSSAGPRPGATRRACCASGDSRTRVCVYPDGDAVADAPRAFRSFVLIMDHIVFDVSRTSGSRHSIRYLVISEARGVRCHTVPGTAASPRRDSARAHQPSPSAPVQNDDHHRTRNAFLRRTLVEAVQAHTKTGVIVKYSALTRSSPRLLHPRRA